ncbi:Hypothetical predicted protein [Mytilus galloprovincialis]|uniref:Uncharacterized protein n=1 Tax=Mytilus galloprovincialis TaxID=29158 RepID=A0A8B6HE58_MYTGA|nr:Hypothetical predicted protein [Mytilus galloprovincialis]
MKLDSGIFFPKHGRNTGPNIHAHGYNSPLLKLEKEYNLTTTEYDGNIYLCEKPQTDKDTAVAVDNLEKLNIDQTDMNFTLEHLTQRDMPLPESLSMNTTKNDNPVNFFDIDLTSPIQQATPTVGEITKAINTIIENRHHILTLECTMRKESARTPIILNTNIDLNHSMDQMKLRTSLWEN